MKTYPSIPKEIKSYGIFHNDNRPAFISYYENNKLQKEEY